MGEKITLYSYGNPYSPTPSCKREFNICVPTSLMGCPKSLEERWYVVIIVKQLPSPPLKAREVLQKNTGGEMGETMSKVSFLWLEQSHATKFFREEDANDSHFSVWFELVII